MTSKALAIKWRPKRFDFVVGQEHVVKTLKNALEQNRLHHAWLLTGTRGVGKTSLARILAKALNCFEGIKSEPCGNCSACEQINLGRAVDVIELDAASNTQVDNMRELLDSALYAPSSLRFKVFIIDEVHMLSKSAFNAMLKTLEEPPAHVKFILATTDPQKVPVTVLSRCLQLNLKKIHPKSIAGQVETILSDEKLEFSSEALSKIAIAADGSMRDALSLLDQAIALGDGHISTKVVTDMLGGLDTGKLVRLLEALAEGDGQQLMLATTEILDSSAPLDQVLASLATSITQMSILQKFPTALDDSLEQKDKLIELSNRFDPEELQLMYQIAIHGRRDFEWAPDEFSGFSMVVLRMHAFKPEERGSYSQKPVEQKKVEKKKIIEEKNTGEPLDIRISPNQWAPFVKQLKLGGMAGMLASNCELKSCTDNLLEFVVPNEFANLLNDSYIKKFHIALEKNLKRKIKVKLNIATIANTPLKTENEHKRNTKNRAINSLETDPSVKSLIRHFDATIIEESVQPKKNKGS